MLGCVSQSWGECWDVCLRVGVSVGMCVSGLG